MASKFWVGGTGTWDNSTTTHWAITTGGAGGTAVPTTGDSVTFDGSSGGGVVSVDTSVNGLALNSITCGAFTGTLDFSGGNPSMSFTQNFSVTGTGVRTINLGSGTFTFTGTNTNCWDATTTTSLTPTFGNATFAYSTPSNGNTQNFVGGGLSYGPLSVGGRTNGSILSITGSNTFSSVSIAGKCLVQFASGSTTTITNALNINAAGSSSALAAIQGSANATAATWAVASGSVFSWSVLKNLTFTGNTPVASNSFDLGNNTNVTINVPAGGSSGKFIGG